jgi:SAM-dependent methyltransferase
MSLERELAPVTHHLKGRVLNAGCGNRDISAYLAGAQATEVESCDIASAIPGAILCDLTDIPRPDGTYDSILCNAVLEHVPDPERVMSELHRLLVPGGHVVIAVPFLQPLHPTPSDFRRYTGEGIEQLAERTGFRVVELRPVHSFAQTLGWLFWAYLEERRSRVGQLVCWIPVYVVTRLFQAPPRGQVVVANGFQAVLEKR